MILKERERQYLRVLPGTGNDLIKVTEFRRSFVSSLKK